jgi:hypothetical protein
LLKNSILNIFGDSFSTPYNWVEPSKSFWGLAAKDLSVTEIVNYSHSGFSLDHVIHILLNEDFNFEDDYFLIGIPPLFRNVVYNDNSNSKWTATTFNTEFVSKQIPVSSLDNTLKFTFEQQILNNQEELDRFNTEWLDVQSLEKIFLLYQYMTSNNAKFLILNLTRPIMFQELWPAGQGIMRKVNALKECVIFDNTFQSVNFTDRIKPADFDRYGWVGHHGAAGNLNWYNKIVKNKMIELNWINNA